MSRNLWEDESGSAAGSSEAARKAMFPAMSANLWMSRGDDAWTTDTAGAMFINLCSWLRVEV